MKKAFLQAGEKPLSEAVLDDENFNRAFEEGKYRGLSDKQALEYAKVILSLIQRDREILKRRL